MATSVRWIIITGVALGGIINAIPAFAQEPSKASPELTGFWMTTPHPELAIPPGKTESIPLTLRNSGLPPQRASLEVSGLPAEWEWKLKGGGREISAVIVAPDENERINLELTPPAKPDSENISLEIRARHGNQVATLPLAIRLSETAAAELTLEPELPALRGTARSTFSFKVKVTNEGAEDGLFNLTANVPEGFQTRFKRGYGSEEITGVPIEAGATENITLEVIPSRATPAGRYPVAMTVSGGEANASTELSLEVTGQPEIRIVGPQERLSGHAVAGEETSFPFAVLNAGSAPATDLELAATAPSGWTVELDPKELASVAPNTPAEFNVKITPSERAIAGDYMVTVRASGGNVSESVQFRTTVSTSTLWGIAGLGTIAAATIVLGLAVMRYGRR